MVLRARGASKPPAVFCLKVVCSIAQALLGRSVGPLRQKAPSSLALGVAREFAGRGNRCLSISPASVDTVFQMVSGTSEEQAKRALDSIPMKRIAEADEIGELVLFLCSDACQFMTGDTVYVSCGGGFRCDWL